MLKIRPFIAVLGFILLSTQVQSQTFSTVNTSIPGLGRTSTVWGDYDNDGDLDLAIQGGTATDVATTRIYRNDNGVFTDIGANLVALRDGCLNWVDYDKDGNLDLFIMGIADSYERCSILYKNEGNGNFVKSQFLFPGVASGKSAWGDLDKDGYPDLVLSGDTLSLNAFTAVYRNLEGNGFQKLDVGLPDLVSSIITIGDVDCNGDLDIILGGDGGSGNITKIYYNYGMEFIAGTWPFEGTTAGSIALVDVNRDGYPDIISMGMDFLVGESIFKIYINNQNDNWTEQTSYFSGLFSGNISLADFNLDGITDFVATGKSNGCGSAATFLYLGIGNGKFNELPTDFPPMTYASVAAADYDLDGDPDLILSGINGNGYPQTLLYKNDLSTNIFGSAPVPTVSPMKEIISIQYFEGSGWSMIFSWAPVEVIPQNKSLSYNVAVGISPQDASVLPVASDLITERAYLPGIGNAGQDTIKILEKIRDGGYYWSTQTVDAAYRTSGFSEWELFMVLIGIEETNGKMVLGLYPNPAQNVLSVNLAFQPATKAMASITDLNGKIVKSFLVTDKTTVTNIDDLQSGLYLLSLNIGNELITAKFIKSN